MLDDQFRDRLFREVVDEANDVLDGYDLTLSRLRPGVDAATDLRRLFGQFAALRVQVRFLDRPLIDIALHRLCDYLDDLTAPTQAQIADLFAYSSKLHELLDGKVASGDAAGFARGLPGRRPKEMEHLAQTDIEIMLVEPNKTAAKLVSRELRACGYRVTNVQDSIDALTYAVRTRPDMIIASAVLDAISGIDLACALGAMPATREIPFAVLTSYDRGHKALADLPQAVAVLKKGAQFGDDLADALARFGIT